MSFTEGFKENVPLEIKVFSRWVSNKLNEVKGNIEVKDISKDLSNGVALVELAKVLTGKETTRQWSENPKKNIEMIRNSDLSVQMFFEDGVHLIGIAGKDIHDNNVKIIRGYIWTLIERYSINRSIYEDLHINNSKIKNNNDFLLQWAINRIIHYPNIHNFHPYNLAMLALLDTYEPDKINFYKLDQKDHQNIGKIIMNVMKQLDIPIYILPEEIENNEEIDKKILLTQLAAAKIRLEKLPIAPSMKVEENRIISHLSDIQPIDEEKQIENTPIIESQQQRQIEQEIEIKTLDKKEEEEEVFKASQVEEDNKQYAGRKFGLIMKMKESDLKDCNKIEQSKESQRTDKYIEFAITMVEDKKAYLNPAGLKLSLTLPNIENNVFQQFTFGKDEWNTVIDSVQQRGMVWDVANEFDLNPPEGTPFYLFPFHGRHNQHFVYKNNKIYAQQNGQVITYVGGENPFVTMPPSEKLSSRQTFNIQLL